MTANEDGGTLAALTDRAGTLTSDSMWNRMDMGAAWDEATRFESIYEGYDRTAGELEWEATRFDLIFGSNPRLRAIAEVYGSDDGEEQFVHDFVEAWSNVMQADRFDLD